MNPTLLVCGGSQAEALTIVLNAIAAEQGGFRARYALQDDDEAQGDLLCVQSGSPAAQSRAGKSKRTTVTFPFLECRLFWPLSSANPYAQPELPLFPAGRFPYGDGFIINCIEQGLASDEILNMYLSGVWFDTWPDLDRYFAAESQRLLEQDAPCTVRLSSYVLKHFRKQRLFSAPQNPTNRLLLEVARRILQECLSPGFELDVARVWPRMGVFDLLGSVTVPIHPKVAEHFGLEWYDAGESYAFADGQRVTYAQYFERMISSMTKRQKASV